MAGNLATAPLTQILREQRAVTIGELSALSGVPERTIGRIKAGDYQRLNFWVADRLATALKHHIEELWGADARG